MLRSEKTIHAWRSISGCFSSERPNGTGRTGIDRHILLPARWRKTQLTENPLDRLIWLFLRSTLDNAIATTQRRRRDLVKNERSKQSNRLMLSRELIFFWMTQRTNVKQHCGIHSRCEEGANQQQTPRTYHELERTSYGNQFNHECYHDWLFGCSHKRQWSFPLRVIMFGHCSLNQWSTSAATEKKIKWCPILQNKLKKL